ncbi:rRNA pseudouridine synthase [Trichocoleus sp. FACHB-591]|uniref:pseudouridine synthase n=1 Tax=Trichocoleus sp. FACHB-591 TaxID=2692872 RepID=UPI0016864ED1|nr:pseudouridine synthase [Trichocoleus sp. FACHB-591]MBD2095202.1 rRNA pseudouridine synthase [Trichocoleus sp. FACHB-591]
MEERLHKILAQWGIASRRHAEKMILDGRVRLNGTVAQLGQKADTQRDRIEVDGVIIQPTQRPQHLYLLLNKPVGVVSTCDDPWQRSTVLDLLPEALQQGQGLHPVGRLDFDSTGALLLTNDGELTFLLTHPRHQIPKTYNVWVQGRPSEAVLQQWRRGVMLSNRKTSPAQVRVLDRQMGKTLLEIVLHEGRNRQIRRVAEQLGHPVLELHRVAIGPIQLEQLPPGQYRTLTDYEINFLQTETISPKQGTGP